MVTVGVFHVHRVLGVLPGLYRPMRGPDSRVVFGHRLCGRVFGHLIRLRSVMLALVPASPIRRGPHHSLAEALLGSPLVYRVRQEFHIKEKPI